MAKRYRHRYNFIELYTTMRHAFRAIGKIIKNRRKKIISEEFVERIMLAVTEVNGCEACAYAHTKMALKQGFSLEEIEAFLKGDDAYHLPEEARAIIFAQHYADSNGRPDYEAYLAFKKEYGPDKTKIIVGAIQVMMLGNVSGLPLSAMLSRFKGHPYENSYLFYEIMMQLAIIPFFPIALIHAFISILYDKLNISFEKRN